MAGRKKINIDWDYAGRLAESFCTGVEIASALGIGYETLVRRCEQDQNINFGEFIRQKRAKGAKTLRQLQLKAAMDGSIPMQIWLGKQYLGQSEKREEKIEVKNSPQIIWGGDDDEEETDD